MSHDHHDSSNIILCRGTRWMRNERNRSRRIACHRRSQCRATAAHLRIHHAFKISRRTLAWRCLAPFLAPSSSSPQNDRSVLVIPLIPPSITCVIVYSTERDSRFPHLHWRACHRSSSPQTPERTIPSKFLPPESLSGVLAICRLGVVEQSIGN